MSRHRIGLVGDLGHLRPPLEAADFNPYGGLFSQDVTTQIDLLLEHDPTTPVLAASDPDDPQGVHWLSTLLDSAARVVVIGQVPAGVTVPANRHVPSSGTLADALLACGTPVPTVPDASYSVPLTPPPGAAAGAIHRAIPAGAEQTGSPSGPVRHTHPGSSPSSPATPGDLTSTPVPAAIPASETPEPRAGETSSVPHPDTGANPAGHPFGAPADPVAAVFDRTNGDRNPHQVADVIIVFGGRGGLGKTTFAAALAATASSRGLRTVLVDGNVAQGDQHLLLRLDPNRPVPSAYDAARTGRPGDAIASPDLLDQLRGGRRDRVGFALVAAPPDNIPGSVQVTTPAVYRGVINHAARLSDLVVIDTHPISPPSPGGMVTDLILPLLRGGAWGLGLTDSSIPGLKHLERVLEYLTDQGVPQDRLMTIVNRVPTAVQIDMDLLGGRLARLSHWTGPVHSDDDEIPNRSNSGILLNDLHVMAHQLERVLNRVCDLEVRTAPPDPRRRRGGLLGLLGRA